MNEKQQAEFWDKKFKEEQKCKHDECTRWGLKERKGFCNECIQLKSHACNYCLRNDGKKGEDKKDKMFWGVILAIIIVIIILLVLNFT